MKMKDQDFIEKLQDQLKPMLEQVENGMEARDAAIEIYKNGLGKSEYVAEVMTDATAELIEIYHANVESCSEDSRPFLERELDKRVDHVENTLERCRIYHRILVHVQAYLLYAQGQEQEARAYEESNQTLACTEEEAAQKEMDLRAMLLEALETMPFAAAQLPGLLEQMNAADFEGLDTVVAYGRKSKDLKLLLSMQAYVNALTGQYEDIPSDVSREQIVNSVCAAVDTIAVAAELESGTITQAEADQKLRRIGTVLAAGAAVMALIFLPPVFVPLMVAVAVVSLGKGLKTRTGKALQTGKNALHKLGVFAKGTVGIMGRGLKKLASQASSAAAAGTKWLMEQLSFYASVVADFCDSKLQQETAPAEQETATAEEELQTSTETESDTQVQPVME